ncbi:putative glucokinase, ROK family [Alkaliphilus metalliredigens QYMF]|uniref:Glucokinase n=1 Tax=Alkaliphilus metalliredigens (strain QYMF) TaxID=293826 RepID=A6TVI4_ALKMQ|nr:ROK family protein [Alkaliphilus metalliredigens]ABR50202.1 putative glucokinase, ROK family [Alkaliphilus metalliredigens QYMF]
MKYIGIDLGGTSIKAGLVNEVGEILKRCSEPTPVKEGYRAVVQVMVEMIDQLIKQEGISKEEINCIGVGIPGVCNKEGFVYYATNLFWENIPLAEALQEKTGLSVYVENDATVAAMGESVKGALTGVKNAIFLTLGTGVGGGLVINNQVYSGNHGIGSELGHMVIGENFYDCNCGNNGCLETFASATALTKYTQKLIKEGKESMLIEKTQGEIEAITAKLIFECAYHGDAVSIQAIERLVKYLSIGIANLINILAPEVIAIGGGVSQAGDYLLDKLNKTIPQYVWCNHVPHAKIVLAELKNDAGIIGSAMFARARD